MFALRKRQVASPPVTRHSFGGAARGAEVGKPQRVTHVSTLVLVVLLGGCGGGSETATSEGGAPTSSATTSGAATTPAAPPSPATLTLKIGEFCPKVDQAAVAAVIGEIGLREQVKPGPDPNGGPPSPNYGCFYASKGKTTTTTAAGGSSSTTEQRSFALFMRGRPVTEAEFKDIVVGSCAAQATVDASSLGPVSDARICEEKDGTPALLIKALFGETYFGCKVRLPPAEMSAAIAQEATEVCADTARSLATT